MADDLQVAMISNTLSSSWDVPKSTGSREQASSHIAPALLHPWPHLAVLPPDATNDDKYVRLTYQLSSPFLCSRPQGPDFGARSGARVHRGDAADVRGGRGRAPPSRRRVRQDQVRRGAVWAAAGDDQGAHL